MNKKDGRRGEGEAEEEESGRNIVGRPMTWGRGGAWNAGRNFHNRALLRGLGRRGGFLHKCSRFDKSEVKATRFEEDSFMGI